jgi:hypothetical protein
MCIFQYFDANISLQYLISRMEKKLLKNAHQLPFLFNSKIVSSFILSLIHKKLMPRLFRLNFFFFLYGKLIYFLIFDCNLINELENNLC